MRNCPFERFEKLARRVEMLMDIALFLVILGVVFMVFGPIGAMIMISMIVVGKLRRKVW